MTISATGLPNAANGLAAGFSVAVDVGVGGTISVGLITSFSVVAPNEKDGVLAGASFALSLSLSAMMEPKKLGFAAESDVPKEKDGAVEAAGLAKKSDEAAGAFGGASFSAIGVAAAPKENAGGFGGAAASVAAVAAPKEKAGLAGSAAAGAGAPRRDNRLGVGAAGVMDVVAGAAVVAGVSFFGSSALAAGAPNEKPDGTLKAGI